MIRTAEKTQIPTRTHQNPKWCLLFSPSIFLDYLYCAVMLISTNLFDFQKTLPPKRSKVEAKKSVSSGKSSSTNDVATSTWQLDKMRTVQINDFRGKLLVDIREYYEDKDGSLKPGKKGKGLRFYADLVPKFLINHVHVLVSTHLGISLSIEQYNKFKKAIPEIDEALKNQ